MQTLAALISALLVETGVMEGAARNAEWLGWILTTVVSGHIIASFVVIFVKWSTQARQEIQVDHRIPLAETIWVFIVPPRFVADGKVVLVVSAVSMQKILTGADRRRLRFAHAVTKTEMPPKRNSGPTRRLRVVIEADICHTRRA